MEDVRILRNKQFSDAKELRLLTECFILVGSAVFGATFNLVTRVGLPFVLEHRKIVVLELIIYHQIIVSPPKVHFGLYDLVQIFPACSSDTYQKMYGETLNSQC